MMAMPLARSASITRILRLQWVTLGWMVVECSVALTAAWKTRSVSLLAFGSDSFVEVISASVVLLQFVLGFSISQLRAARVCGLLLYGLAGVVTVTALSGLLHRVEAETSMAITAGALLLMPILAHMTKDEAERSGNKALRADAVQSATCAYLAALTLGDFFSERLFASIGSIEWLHSRLCHSCWSKRGGLGGVRFAAAVESPRIATTNDRMLS